MALRPPPAACILCGTDLQYRGVGPHPRYCGAKCRAAARDHQQDYQRNRQQILARKRANRAANPEVARAAERRMARDRYSRLPRERERRLVAARAWRKAHPQAIALHAVRRRARRAAASGSHTLAEWREKCALFANLCAYCGEAKPLERDHAIPLTRGGSDFISNIIPACHSCNSRKHTSTPAEYLARRAVA